MKLLEKENLKMLPLAALGLAVGIGNVILKPFFQEEADHIGKLVMAHIEYWQGGKDA